MPALSAFIGCRAPSVRLDINSELYGGHGYSMALLQELPLFSVLMVEKSLPFSNLPFCLDRLRCSLWDCSGLGFNRFKAYQTNFLLFPVNAAIILREDWTLSLTLCCSGKHCLLVEHNVNDDTSDRMIFFLHSKITTCTVLYYLPDVYYRHNKVTMDF